MDGIHSSPSTGDKKSRQFFLDNLQVGNVVAFNTDNCMASGRIIDIDNLKVTIRTLNGSIFYQEKDTIVWVKQGTRWPLGIYNALKYPKKGDREV